MENLKQIDDKEKEDKLSLFYDKGFMPLYLHFKENDNREIIVGNTLYRYSGVLLIEKDQQKMSDYLHKKVCNGNYYLHNYVNNLLTLAPFPTLLDARPQRSTSHLV